ncbi:ABC transporter ATP-binding protein [Microbacterium sp. A204]|uniref:ABC transporter ATP-binding protein n=1 Tax=Microbacterium sp. A204 TaxID=3457321 RepID=UPI003FD125BC
MTIASPHDVSRPDSPFIEVRDVSQVFRTTSRGEVAALKDIDLTIREGEFLSVLGPSGCGKSTLMRIVAGLVPPTSGEVLLQGKRVTKPGRDVGVVFQQAALFPWRTVKKNVLLSAEMLGLDSTQAEARAEELLEMVGLGHAKNLYPYELSGGMQQRASIARALLHDPALLLMDEPFGALDALTRETMGLELLRIWDQSRKTVIFITHDVDEALFLADRVLVMAARPGRINELIEVDLPRPRDLDMMSSPEFGETAKHLRHLLGARTGE